MNLYKQVGMKMKMKRKKAMEGIIIIIMLMVTELDVKEIFKVQVEHMKGGEKKVVCPQEESVV